MFCPAFRSWLKWGVRGVQVKDLPAFPLAAQDDGAPAQLLVAEVEGGDGRVAAFLHEQLPRIEGQVRRPRFPHAADDRAEGLADRGLPLQPDPLVLRREER